MSRWLDLNKIDKVLTDSGWILIHSHEKVKSYVRTGVKGELNVHRGCIVVTDQLTGLSKIFPADRTCIVQGMIPMCEWNARQADDLLIILTLGAYQP